MIGPRRVRGFTLLEVMVALMIFALFAVAVERAGSQYFSHFERIENKTLATWIAQNTLAKIHLASDLPAVSENSDDLDYADFHWKVTTKVSDTGDPTIRRVDVTVDQYQDNGNEPRQQLVFSGFVGKN